MQCAEGEAAEGGVIMASGGEREGVLGGFEEMVRHVF